MDPFTLIVIPAGYLYIKIVKKDTKGKKEKEKKLSHHELIKSIQKNEINLWGEIFTADCDCEEICIPEREAEEQSRIAEERFRIELAKKMEADRLAKKREAWDKIRESRKKAKESRDREERFRLAKLQYHSYYGMNTSNEIRGGTSPKPPKMPPGHDPRAGTPIKGLYSI